MKMVNLTQKAEQERKIAIDIVKAQFRLEDYENEAKRICAKYGLKEVAPHDVSETLLVEREQAECDDCAGLPCRKSQYRRCVLPKVEIYNGKVYRRNYICAYQLAELKKQKEQRDREKAEEKKVQALKSARLPKQYTGKTLADYKVDANNKDAAYFARYSEQYHLSAFLHGDCGCGKTMLAAIVAQMWIDAGKSVIFIKVPALLDDIRATYNGEGEESDIYKAMREVDLLVLDDFGMEKPSLFAGTTLCKIIDDRYDNKAAMIITSNYTLDKIEEELNNAYDGKNYNGTRIADRLKSFCRPIKIKGGSRR